ncbi:MAG TPA: hypothetical protein VF136_11810, partial [Methylomirabilota bacterium]
MKRRVPWSPVALLVACSVSAAGALTAGRRADAPAPQTFEWRTARPGQEGMSARQLEALGD